MIEPSFSTKVVGPAAYGGEEESPLAGEQGETQKVKESDTFHHLVRN